MTVTAQKSYGTTLAYDSLATTPGAIASLTNVGGLELTASALDATDHDNAAGYKQFIQGLRDSGECAVTGNLNTGDAGQNAVVAHYQKDTEGGVEPMVMTFPDCSTWEFDAIVTRLKLGDAPVDGILPFNATFKVTGTPVWTAGGGS